MMLSFMIKAAVHQLVDASVKLIKCGMVIGFCTTAIMQSIRIKLQGKFRRMRDTGL